MLGAFEQLDLDLSAKRSTDPPKWTLALTADADMREWRTLNARRRRRLQALQKERDVRTGNLRGD